MPLLETQCVTSSPTQSDWADSGEASRTNQRDASSAVRMAGHSPALAQRIRRELEVQFGPEYVEWLEQLGKIRQQLFASKIDPEERRRLLHELASREAFERARSEGFRSEAISLEKIS